MLALQPSLRPLRRPLTTSGANIPSAAAPPSLARKTSLAPRLAFGSGVQTTFVAARHTRKPHTGVASAAPFDGEAVVKYAALTAAQLGVIVLLMAALDAALLSNLAPTQARYAVAAFFALNSLRSRTFSFLPAPRPTLRGEQQEVDMKKRPAWMPPVLVFPVVRPV